MTISYLYIAQASACDKRIVADLYFASEISFVNHIQGGWRLKKELAK